MWDFIYLIECTKDKNSLLILPLILTYNFNWSLFKMFSWYWQWIKLIFKQIPCKILPTSLTGLYHFLILPIFILESIRLFANLLITVLDVNPWRFKCFMFTTHRIELQFNSTRNLSQVDFNFACFLSTQV